MKRAALYRTRGGSCLPVSWGLRLLNGHDEQMITVFLPSPFLDATGHHRLREPDWSRLGLWDVIRHEFLGLDADPLDRQKGPACRSRVAPLPAFGGEGRGGRGGRGRPPRPNPSPPASRGESRPTAHLAASTSPGGRPGLSSLP